MLDKISTLILGITKEDLALAATCALKGLPGNQNSTAVDKCFVKSVIDVGKTGELDR